jgi:hypothetical protein
MCEGLPHFMCPIADVIFPGEQPAVFLFAIRPYPSVISIRLFSGNAKKLEILDGFRGLWM